MAEDEGGGRRLLGEEDDDGAAADSGRPPLSRARVTFMLLSVGGAYMSFGMILACQPPFYPTEAERKGARPAQYGFVFGIAYLSAFLSAPFFAQAGDRLGPKLVYNTGTYTQGICGGLLFGLLDKVDDLGAFLGLSYFLRAIFGMADAASFSSILAIFTDLFPERGASMMAFNNSCYGFGYTVAPALGSFLYTLGGFSLPFYIVGFLSLSFSTMVLFALPKVKTGDKGSAKSLTTSSVGSKRLTALDALKAPSIWLPFVDNMLMQGGYLFIEAMLAPHVQERADFTQNQVSLAFLVMGLTYLACSMPAGRVCDWLKKHHPQGLSWVSAASHFIMFLSASLMGPSPLLGALMPDLTPPMVFSAVSMAGCASALNMVSTFARSRTSASMLGYSDDINTYLVLTGLWTSSFFLGGFLGPTAGGALVQAFGFRSSVGALAYLYMVALLSHVAKRCCVLATGGENICSYDQLNSLK